MQNTEGKILTQNQITFYKEEGYLLSNKPLFTT